jgi:hypothetical protein
VPKPQTLVCNCFKDYDVVLIFVIELIMPRNWTIFAHIVHTISINKHLGKADND